LLRILSRLEVWRKNAKAGVLSKSAERSCKRADLPTRQTNVTPFSIEAVSRAEMVGNCERVNCTARFLLWHSALRLTQAHQFRYEEHFSNLDQGASSTDRQQIRNATARLGSVHCADKLGRRTGTAERVLLWLLSNWLPVRWWVAIGLERLSDGIRQVLSAGCGGRRMICDNANRTSEQLTHNLA
jgi:hypothetical protein